jgi:hypothetical protein
VCIRVLQCSETRIFVGRISNRCLWDGAVLLTMQLRSDLRLNEQELMLTPSLRGYIFGGYLVVGV